MNLSSLRTRSLLTVLAVVLPVLVVYAYLSHQHVSYQLGRRLDGRMRHEVTMLKEAVLRSRGDNERLHEIVDIMPIDTFPQRRLYGIWANDQLLLATPDLPFTVAPRADSGYSDERALNRNWRVLTQYVAPSMETAERRITIVVADPTYARDALIREGLIDQILPLFVAVPVLIIGIYIALMRSLRPLTKLAEQIRDRSADRLQPISADSVPSEALPITDSVNALMARLAQSLERERRFTADAAHELRTPLAALKAHAQVAMRAQDEALKLESLQSIARTVSRTDRMISQLLILARLDPQVTKLQSETVDLGQIANQTLADLQSLAEARGQQLRLNVNGNAIVHGSATALSILARNLIENAILYSNEGEPIDVLISCDATHGVLEVSDTGPGIPDAAKRNVFDRFHRMPDAKTPGTGLGLSIVQRIADLHNARISLHDRESGRGLRATVRIPI